MPFYNGGDKTCKQGKSDAYIDERESDGSKNQRTQIAAGNFTFQQLCEIVQRKDKTKGYGITSIEN